MEWLCGRCGLVGLCVCLYGDCVLGLIGKRSLPALVAASGASLTVPPGLQRLSSSKGQNRRETATQSHGPLAKDPHYSSLHARLPGCRRDGQVKSPSVPESVRARMCCGDSFGSGDRTLQVTASPALLFFSAICSPPSAIDYRQSPNKIPPAKSRSRTAESGERLWQSNRWLLACAAGRCK